VSRVARPRSRFPKTSRWSSREVVVSAAAAAAAAADRSPSRQKRRRRDQCQRRRAAGGPCGHRAAGGRGPGRVVARAAVTA